MGLMLFKIFTKVPLSNVIWNLKTSKRSFSKFSVWTLQNEQHNLNTLKKTSLPNTLFFSELQFLVFNHWKLLFWITYQTSLGKSHKISGICKIPLFLWVIFICIYDSYDYIFLTCSILVVVLGFQQSCYSHSDSLSWVYIYLYTHI